MHRVHGTRGQKESKVIQVDTAQMLIIPSEFELLAETVLIHQDGQNLIIEPVMKHTELSRLLKRWQKEAPLDSADSLPVIEDIPAQPENIF